MTTVPRRRDCLPDMASINGSNGGGGGGGNNNNNHNNDDVSMAYDGTPPDSHDANRSPSGVTTPGGGQGEASSTPYMAVQNGRKRKADGTSSRGVANLTPEQLAKKRANDREAQRAIRERTKNTIENLERRIKELESQQPFQELQNVIRLKDAVLAENEDLKRRMQSILALLQPLAGPQGLNGQSRQYPTAHIIALADGSDLAAATARQSPLPMAPPPQAQMYHAHQSAQPAAQSQSQSQSQIQTQTQIQQQQQAQAQQQHAHPQQYDAAFAQHHLHPDLRNHHASPSPQRPLPPSANGLGLSHGHGQQQQQQQQHDMRRWSPSLAPSPGQYNAQPQPQLPLQPQLQQLPSPSTASASASQHAPPAATYPPDATQQQQQQPDRFGLHHLVDHQPKPSSPSAIDARRRDLIPTASDEPPLYKRLPLNTEPTCTLDGILRGFEAERRRAAQSGTPAATLVGPSYPSISSLLNPTRAANSHPLSKVFTDILSRFPSISEVPEQIAVLYIMFLIMRWHIAPTQENYDRLPEWARPVKSQLEIAHPAWIDHLPWYA